MMNHMFYFLLALLTAATGDAAVPVLDTDGDIVSQGTSYYVLPVIRGRGGGLTLSGRGNKPCPLDIVQEASEVDKGIPVKFSNWKSRVGFVPESENLNIEMDVAATMCAQSTYWWIDKFDVKRWRYFMVAGPKPEGQYSLMSFFRIVKSHNLEAYEFENRPDTVSKHVYGGVSKDEKNVWRLALFSEPFLVTFAKANVTESLSVM